MKEKKASELQNYEKDYLSRLNGKKSTKSLERKKPAAKKTKKKVYFYQKDLSLKNSLKNFRKADVVVNLASLTDAEASLKIKKKI